MKFIINILKGILIGTGAILPGISSGVLCVILGIYENMVSRVLHFFQNIKENFWFFLPLIIGGIISIISVSKILLYLLETHTVPTSFIFIGLILGCIPNIFKHANSHIESKHNNTFLKYLFLTYTFTFSLYLLAIGNTNIATSLNESNTVSQFDLIKSGFLMSAGIVIPGVSNTEILMLLGTYDIYLEGLANLNFATLIPMGIGLIMGAILFLKLIDILFKNFKTYTYYAIIGFTLGAVFVLFPGFELSLLYFFSISLMLFGFFISYKLSSLEKN